MFFFLSFLLHYSNLVPRAFLFLIQEGSGYEIDTTPVRGRTSRMHTRYLALSYVVVILEWPLTKVTLGALFLQKGVKYLKKFTAPSNDWELSPRAALSGNHWKEITCRFFDTVLFKLAVN